jgi:TetR/AcrR family transcriptional repressor of nem operon
MVQNVTMARPRNFDRDTVRDRAMILFWRQGYQATALPDLLAATELSRSSFYAAFGDKRALYLECLHLFAERTRELLLTERHTRTPIDALEAFFRDGVEGAGARRAAWGCMMVNTIIEASGVDEGLRVEASALINRMQALFAETLQDAGFAPADAERWAAHLMLVNEGLRVESRRKVPIETRAANIEITFAALRAAGAPSIHR